MNQLLKDPAQQLRRTLLDDNRPSLAINIECYKFVSIINS